MEDIMRKPLLQYIRNGETADYSRMDEELRTVTREIGVRNMYIRNRLYDLIGAMNRKGISATALKGAHLIHSVYPFGIRPIEDIDLLLERKDFAAADAILRGFGYGNTVSGLDMRTHLQFSNKVTYLNESHPVIPVDIHFSLGPYPYLGRLGPEQLRRNTELLRTSECVLNVLRPEMLLLHLCLHLFQHHFDNWQVSGCDIAAVINREEKRIDWQRFKELTEANRLELPVAYSFRKAAELGEFKIPASLETGMKSANRYEQWIFRSSLKQQTESDRYFLQFAAAPGFRLKLAGALKIAAPGRSYLRQSHRGSYFRYAAFLIKTAAGWLAALRRNF
jgi:hypothetical protein